MKKFSSSLNPKKPFLRNRQDSMENPVDLPEVALAAAVSYKTQKDVADFINFLLPALERNSYWLNGVLEKQSDFRCALLVGAGPSRFKLQEIIYPTEDDIKLEVNMKDDEDFDKIAIAALLRLSNGSLEKIMNYTTTRLAKNKTLHDDIEKGKTLGIDFFVLRPIDVTQYRVMEKITIEEPLKGNCKKRQPDDKLVFGPPVKRTRKVIPTT